MVGALVVEEIQIRSRVRETGGTEIVDFRTWARVV
jgi:hypothetical protein